MWLPAASFYFILNFPPNCVGLFKLSLLLADKLEKNRMLSVFAFKSFQCQLPLFLLKACSSVRQQGWLMRITYVLTQGGCQQTDPIYLEAANLLFPLANSLLNLILQLLGGQTCLFDRKSPNPHYKRMTFLPTPRTVRLPLIPFQNFVWTEEHKLL